MHEGKYDPQHAHAAHQYEEIHTLLFPEKTIAKKLVNIPKKITAAPK
jgi:hypothetical protein